MLINSLLTANFVWSDKLSLRNIVDWNTKHHLILSDLSYLLIFTDEEDPVFSGTYFNISQNTDANLPIATVTWTPPTASDNANEGVTVTSSYNPGYSFLIGTTTVTYTATDPYGNSATTSFDVVITGKMETQRLTRTHSLLVSFFILCHFSRPNTGSVLNPACEGMFPLLCLFKHPNTTGLTQRLRLFSDKYLLRQSFVTNHSLFLWF